MANETLSVILIATIPATIVALIAWLRERKAVKASVRGVDAESFKTYAEAQGLITDSTGRALEIVDRLSLAVDVSRLEIGKLIINNREQQKVIERMQAVLERTQALLEKAELNNEAEVSELKSEISILTKMVAELTGKYNESESELAIKKQHCIEIQKQMKELQNELTNNKK